MNRFGADAEFALRRPIMLLGMMTPVRRILKMFLEFLFVHNTPQTDVEHAPRRITSTGLQATFGWPRSFAAFPHLLLLFAYELYCSLVSRWCTLTVTDPDWRRHSLDVLTDSTYDAAHLLVVKARKERAVGVPKPTIATVFEVVAGGKVYRVAGAALQRWIVERRQKWNAPKGYMFCKRPGLGNDDRLGVDLRETGSRMAAD
jgi:hypothetical protein